MVAVRAEERGLRLFAGLLDYPGPGTKEMAEDLGLAVLAPRSRASVALEGFREFLERSSPAEIEEAYTLAFDLEAPTSLYVGYHLFGDTPRRGPFLVGLKAMYDRSGFEAGPELPDHLAVLIRFLAGRPGLEERRELLDDCLAPALGAIRRGLAARRYPYGFLLDSLNEYLREEGSGGPVGDRP
jgi:nitrate reductase delta subunit